MTHPTEYLSQLIAFESVSHHSNQPISDCVARWLLSLRFEVEHTTYVDQRGVLKKNLVARRDPESQSGDARSPVDSGGMAYFCHTDTVPADRWTGPGGNPFVAVQEPGRIYGRGSCDMKGSLAAMLSAAASIDAAEQTHPLWIVCTADEEVGFGGARYLASQSPGFAELASANPVSIIGEPTRLRVIHAHKGMVGFRIHSIGKAAHSSSLDGINANIAMVPLLQTLLEINEQCHNDPALRNDSFDPPTLGWNFGVSDGMKTVNIVPDHCTAWVSLRPMPGVDGTDLIERVRVRAESLGLDFAMSPGGGPMQTDPQSNCVQTMCRLATPWIGPNHSQAVCYATDACVLGALQQRIVCGPGDIAQAHTVDEFIEIEQLHQGKGLYESAIRHWCC